jgi:predicted PurR-regulated permease PerM
MQISPVLPPDRSRSTDELIGLLSIVASSILAGMIVAMLYFGRDIFVPIALAILLSFVLAPPVRLLQIYAFRGASPWSASF